MNPNDFIDPPCTFAWTDFQLSCMVQLYVSDFAFFPPSRLSKVCCRDSVWESRRQTNSWSYKTFTAVVVCRAARERGIKEGGGLNFRSLQVRIPAFICVCGGGVRVSHRHWNAKKVKYHLVLSVGKLLNNALSESSLTLRGSIMILFGVSGSSWLI